MPSERAPERPLPETRNAGATFWSKAAESVLVVPKCTECGRTFWYPRPRCPNCGSEHVDWVHASGKGAVHTFTIVRQSADPYFRTKVPYAVAMIDLDEGVRIMTNVVDTPLEALMVGMRVEVLFEPAGGGIAIPLFRRA
ncbi:MAG TPA: Zn-ribbon domain-containing OB-fold protein [Casimicrobiaceae bacterium]|nr:Zn-ribbon domain-containing OB-fold protein [Casimicrobiaceae bacterium]